MVMEKRLDEEKHTSHLVAMAVTRVSGANSPLASWSFDLRNLYIFHSYSLLRIVLILQTR